MADPLKKVQAGQPLQMPAEAFNAFVDAARFVRSKRHDVSSGAFPEFRQSGIVRVQNESGADRGRFDVLGIDEPLVSVADDEDQFKNAVALKGVVPDGVAHFGRFVVLLEPLAAGAIGRAFLSGVCPVKLNSGSDEHRFADVADGECGSLRTGPFGAAQILWRDENTEWAIVRLSNAPKRPYALDDCKNQWPTVYVSNDLAESVGQVVKVGGRCYRVRIPDPDEIACAAPLCAVIQATYDDCSACDSCWRLTKCGGAEQKITNSDLAAYAGQVVKLDDGYCWSVSQASDCVSGTPVTVVENYPSCAYCGHCYTLQNCWDAEDSIVVSNDLAAFMGFEPEGVIGRIVEANGKCYSVVSYSDEGCEGATQISPTQHYTECAQCGCFKLTECQPPEDEDPPAILYASSAVDENGGHVDLHDYVGQTVRVQSTGKNYSVAKETSAEHCAGAGQVTVLEAYPTCDDAGLWKLRDCADAEHEIVTYSDLSEFAGGTILKLEDGSCWEVIERLGEEYLEEAVSVDVAETSPSCTVCRKLLVYKLSPGDCRHPGCGGDGGDGGDPPEPIFTREDLHAVVEKWVKVNGHCYYAETSSVEDAGAEDVDDVPALLAYDGPFLGCDDCESQPINATKSVVTRVYVEGDLLKYDVEDWIIVDGRIVGFCNHDAQEVASTTCEE